LHASKENIFRDAKDLEVYWIKQIIWGNMMGKLT